ncbi:hypothetical protein M8J77_001900 [Diaphorina citri]|nr:hypothetical protein M8J77_001900 [Diaphorina citri]
MYLILAVTLIIIMLLYNLSQTCRYVLKFTFFSLGAIIAATIFIPVMLLKPKDYRNGLFAAWGARQISKALGLTWKMRGKEHIVQNSGCVLLINHQSALDLLVLAEIWPIYEGCTVISKREIFYVWPFGLACWLWGTIFIDRLNVEKAQKTINSTGEIIKTKKAKLCMFPEGTRHGGKTLLPFKKGAFHVAIASQTPIQPIVVSQYYFVDDKTKKFDSGRNIISILPPIPTESLTKDNVNDLMDRTYKAMSEEYEKITKENTPPGEDKKDN